jgi:hypothetical protein
VSRFHNSTNTSTAVYHTVSQQSASGGGDGPEAVCCGLHKALHFQWRPNAAKVVILIADAPPHGLGESGDGFPNGCPDGVDPMQAARSMLEAGRTTACSTVDALTLCLCCCGVHTLISRCCVV